MKSKYQAQSLQFNRCETKRTKRFRSLHKKLRSCGWSSDIFVLACAIGIPLCILAATAACAVICHTRRQRLGLGGRTSADDQGAPPHKFADMAAAA